MKQKLVLMSCILSFGYVFRKFETTESNTRGSVGSVGPPFSSSSSTSYRKEGIISHVTCEGTEKVKSTHHGFVWIFRCRDLDVQALPDVLLQLSHVYPLRLLRIVYILRSDPSRTSRQGGHQVRLVALRPRSGRTDPTAVIPIVKSGTVAIIKVIMEELGIERYRLVVAIFRYKRDKSQDSQNLIGCVGDLLSSPSSPDRPAAWSAAAWAQKFSSISPSAFVFGLIR